MDAKRFGRVGWLANGSAVTTERLVWGPRAALRHGIAVVQLFGAEHGPHGATKEGERIADTTDTVTGLPVCSLYAAGPAAVEEALDRCDTVVIDLVDAGARYSTFLATSSELVDAAARAGVPVLVLDRPNRLGRRREGPGLRSAPRSIVGKLDLPIRHGLTLGEILGRHARMTQSGAVIDVVRFDGPHPAEPAFADPYLAPSPNLNGPEAQLLYPGTCLIEGTTLSEGRGTANPFQVIGAPDLDPEALIDELDHWAYPGVRFRAVRFVPVAGKHAHDLCAGVFIHVVDAATLRPVALGVGLLAAAFGQRPDTGLVSSEASDQPFLNLLWGSPALTSYLSPAGDPRAAPDLDVDSDFEASVDGDLLYDG